MNDMKESEDFSADDYRAMAARFAAVPSDADGALTVCEWATCEDGWEYTPSPDERKVVNMLRRAAELKELEESGER